MTQQTYPNSQEAASSSSSGSVRSSTSTADAFPLPFSIGQKKIMDDDGRLVANLADNNVVAPAANICVNDSSHITFGNRTIFNEGVTIYQYIDGNHLPQLQNDGTGQDEVECNKSDIHVQGLVRKKNSSEKDARNNRKTRRNISVGVTCFVLVLITCLAIYFYVGTPDDGGNRLRGRTKRFTDTQHNNQKAQQNIPKKWRHFIIPFLLFLLIVTILLFLYFFKDVIFTRTPAFPPINPYTNRSIQGHPLYSKFNWGALSTRDTPPLLPLPTPLVIISHSATQGCKDFKKCARQVQHIQYDFLNRGQVDIGYNFLIGGDGGIYEGRGWEHQNSLRVKSLSISFIGDFNKDQLGQAAENAAKALLEEGVALKMIAEDYKLIGENQTSPLRYYSPGWNAVKLIRNWEHFFPGTML